MPAPLLRNYEVRTGKVLSREELDSGCLADKLIDADYDLTTSVSVLAPFLPQLTACSSLKNTNFKVFVAVCLILHGSRSYNYDALTFPFPAEVSFVCTTKYHPQMSKRCSYVDGVTEWSPITHPHRW